MKLLFDQNVSHRVIELLKFTYPNAIQVRLAGLENSSDAGIWKYAQMNGYTIVTFDADFLDYAALYGCPPKIIWIRTGNLTTQKIATLFHERIDIINHFINDNNRENGCILELI